MTIRRDVFDRWVATTPFDGSFHDRGVAWRAWQAAMINKVHGGPTGGLIPGEAEPTEADRAALDADSLAALLIKGMNEHDARVARNAFLVGWAAGTEKHGRDA